MSEIPKLCPECGNPLVRSEKYEVPLDRCEACAGSWVSDARLGALAAADWRASATMRRLRAKPFIGCFLR